MPQLDPSSPSSLPFKEDMYRFYAKRRRQPRWLRIVVAIAAVSFIYLVGVRGFRSPLSAIDSLSSAAANTRSPNADDLGLNSHGQPLSPELPLADRDPPRADQGKSKPKAVTNANAKQQYLSDDDLDDLGSLSAPNAAPGKSPLSSADDADDTLTKDDAAIKLETDLRRVFTMVPDELHVRELLRPIENSGKERLREIGLRTRAFRTLFESWEDIHLVDTKDSTRIRDDIVTYLRNTKDLSAISSSRTRADIIRQYESLRYFLTKLSALLFPWTAPYFADHMTLHAAIKHGGRGIVLSGGDGQLSYMMTSARMIRALGCKLPIEVMYLGDDDLGDDARSELESVPGVITRDMKQMVQDEGWDLRGWAGKPFAILLSSFREVVFIDADAMFFQSPEVLFDDEGYEETGALFFRDRLMFPESKRKWLQQILPKPMSRKVRQSRFWTGESGHMQESGVVVVDKWRHFMALLLVTRMNGPDRDGDKEKGIIGTYDMVYGDKETFWLGWELVGDNDYVFHPGEAGTMGIAYEKYSDALSKVQSDEEAEKQKKKEAEDKLLSAKAEEEERLAKIEEDREQAKAVEEKERAQAKKEEDIIKAKKAEEENKAKKAEEDKKAQKAEAERQERKAQAENKAKQDEEEFKAKKAEEDRKARQAADEKQLSEEDEEAKAVRIEELFDKDVAKGDKELEAAKKADVPRTFDGEELQPGGSGQSPDESLEAALDAAKQSYEPVTRRRSKRAVLPADEAEEDEGVLGMLVDGELVDTGAEAVNYTICAPQLLHLGRDGRPLWFNGWILENKFNRDRPKLAQLDSFMMERMRGAKEAAWRLESGNVCCLTSDEAHPFTKEEKDAMKQLQAIAKESGALGKNYRDE